MWRKIAIILPVSFFAFAVLFTSILRTATPKFAFSMPANGEAVLGAQDLKIDYDLAYPGRVLPDHPLWPVKALRDRIWLTITTNSSRKAELKLLFADKRLASSKILFEKDKPEIAFSTLTKAEKYLEQALNQEKENREKGVDTSDFLRILSYASLKHRIMIDEILLMAPEDARPGISETQSYSKSVYEQTMHALNERGMPVPENPFDGE